MSASDAEAWFIREVLPLEAALMQFLRRSWRNQNDIDDLCQDIYARVFEAASEHIPQPTKPFVFATARNLLIDRARRDRIVSFEAVADLDALGVAIDEPGPDRTIIARDELRRLQGALDRLPKPYRDALLMKKVEGLSRKEIAQRLGVDEDTVKHNIANAMYALADFVYGDRADLGGTP
ncbi:MAG TPA: sigma-70 family RNA polymerase sigma factor [Rhizomicrobium sp.]|nr:sigma-70 family RNA polymerase sigma factor [Rhizomicrobium sp.]